MYAYLLLHNASAVRVYDAAQDTGNSAAFTVPAAATIFAQAGSRRASGDEKHPHETLYLGSEEGGQ